MHTLSESSSLKIDSNRAFFFSSIIFSRCTLAAARASASEALRGSFSPLRLRIEPMLALDIVRRRISAGDSASALDHCGRLGSAGSGEGEEVAAAFGFSESSDAAAERSDTTEVTDERRALRLPLPLLLRAALCDERLLSAVESLTTGRRRNPFSDCERCAL